VVGGAFDPLAELKEMLGMCAKTCRVGSVFYRPSFLADYLIKHVFCLLLVLPLGNVLGQSHPVRGVLVDGQTHKGYRGQQPVITFSQAGALVAGSGSDSTGRFQVQHLPPGTYEVRIEDVFKRPETHPGVVVADSARLTFVFPSPCRFVYTRKGAPPCVDGHTDRIIPLLYGLPSAKGMWLAKRGKVHLAGCQMWGCDPQYWCSVHQKEL
jgi:hypothetical protein